MARPPQDTTGELWEFTEYFLEQRGPKNVPQKFLKSAKWEEDYKTHPGYFAGTGSLVIHIEFNFEHLCWTEARYRRTERRWHIHRIADSNLGLDIHLDELTPDEILQVTGEGDSSTPSTLTGQQIRERVEEHTMSQTMDSFEETEDRMSEGQLEYFGEPIDQFPTPNVLTNEDQQEMVDRFSDPEDAQVRATQTETTTTIRLQPDLWANPQTSTIQRAAGENPPSGSGGGGGGGGGGGEGSGGGGSRGGGNPPATGGPPPGPGGGTGGDHRLFGQPPDVFSGDRSKMKEFLTQWELYYNLNHLTSVMGVPYSRCMLFLTFCKGPLMVTWASTIAHDIANHA